jgi:nicotinate-nucleotide adenylyltransferase
MKLGILGGTFDPVHNGHLRLAVEAREALQLDEVVMEVAARSPFKGDVTPSPAEARLKMLSDALQGTPGVRAGDTELNRPPPSYTVDTLETYSSQGHELWCIVGADALMGLPDWKDPDRVLALCHIAVSFRHGENLVSLIESFPVEWQDRIVPFPTHLMEISSTEIRRRVAAGRSIRYLTPDCVIQTIEERRLYVG